MKWVNKKAIMEHAIRAGKIKGYEAGEKIIFTEIGLITESQAFKWCQELFEALNQDGVRQ